jgi:hypothetical protein
MKFIMNDHFVYNNIPNQFQPPVGWLVGGWLRSFARALADARGLQGTVKLLKAVTRSQ